jgi:hypothetical protein
VPGRHELRQLVPVTLKSGLPGEIGALDKDELVEVGIGDREPSVGFQKQAYVLPKVGSTGVPLTTVNVDFTKLKLLRINDRNLVSEINRGISSTTSTTGTPAHRRRGGRTDLARLDAGRRRAQRARRHLGAGSRDDPGDQAGRLSVDGARRAAG